MILDYNVEQYRQMIREDRWQELSAAMDQKWTRYMLAMQAGALSYEEVYQQMYGDSTEFLRVVLDPTGGSVGFVFDKEWESWQKLQEKWNGWLNGQATDDPQMDRFFRALQVCHVPFHMLAVIPEDIAQPIPFSYAYMWVEGKVDGVPAEGTEFSFEGYEGESAKLRVVSGPSREEQSQGGPYTAYSCVGSITKYTTAEERPITMCLYDNYPGDVMLRYERRSGDDYEYQKNWSEYLNWTSQNEMMIHGELDREFGMMSARMEPPHEDYDRRHRMDSFGYGGARPYSEGYAGGYGGGYNGGFGGGYGGGYNNGYNGGGW